jgi:phosphoribosylformimino-5-aminoimidazole carboxamide ribotide isomerase
VAVGLDHRRGEVVVRGWTAGSGRELLGVVAELEDAGAAAFVVTDVERDGMLEGPDRTGLAALLGATTVDVIASGGVAGLDDVRALAALEAGGRRLAGVIVGRALYEGRLTVEEAVAACAP